MWNCHTLLEMNQTYGGGGQLTKVVFTPMGDFSESSVLSLQFIHSFMSMIEAINIIPIDARQKNDARKSQPWSRDDMIDTYQSSVPTLEILISFFQLHSRQLSSLSLSFSNSPSLHRPFFGSNPFFPTLKHPPASF